MSLRTIERLVTKAKDLPEFQVSFLSDLFCFGFDNFFSQTPKRKVGTVHQVDPGHSQERAEHVQPPARQEAVVHPKDEGKTH